MADRQDNRVAEGRESTKGKLFAGTVLVVLCAFILALVRLGESNMAQKLLEIAITGILGAFVGYGYAKWQSSDHDSKFSN